jgi:hypothetical protein
MFLIFSLLSVPIIVLKKQFHKRKIFLTILFAFSVSIYLNHFHASSYLKSENFKEAYSNKKYRSLVTKDDNTFYYNTNYKKVGFSDLEIKLSQNFLMDVPHLPFNYENLKQIYDSTPKSEFGVNDVLLNIKELVKHFIKYDTLISLFIVFSIFILIFGGIRQMALYIILLCWVILVFSIVHFSGTNIFKERVIWSISFVFLFVSIIHLISLKELPLKLSFKLFQKEVNLFAFIIILVISTGIIISIFGNFNKKTIEPFYSIKEDSLYLSVIYPENHPIFEKPSNLSNVYFLGWMSSLPFNSEKKMRYFGVDQSIYILSDKIKNITWYFKYDYNVKGLKLDELVIKYYEKNNSSVTVEKHLIKNNSDTIIRYRFKK